MVSGYDIIGDIHGQAEKLKELLGKLGYKLGVGGFYAHPERQVIFVGDFIDRHPQQAETLHIVKNMIDGGSALAVMGNHEFNSICFATEHPTTGHVRKHTSNNIRQHQSFLNEFQQHTDSYRNQIAWFKTLPVYIDLKDIFVVHACWHPESLKTLTPYLNEDNTLKDHTYIDFAEYGTPFFRAIEMILKGPEHKIPNDVAFYCKDGIRRDRARVSWWVDDNQPTFDRLEHRQKHVSPEQIASVNATSITHQFNKPANPVFIGHYWMSGTPEPLTDKIACVDYSAAAPKRSFDRLSLERRKHSDPRPFCLVGKKKSVQQDG